MRRTLIAGNWKMNLNRATSQGLAEAILAGHHANHGGKSISEKTELLVCPPTAYLDVVRQSLTGSSIGWGAQDVYFEQEGAYTGEISTTMLHDLGCRYVILGHSERRHVIGETDALINKKVLATLAAGLVPILCVGETLEEREAGATMAVVDSQFNQSLAGVTAEQMAHVVIAYEPVWAIGTGKTATPEQAQEVHADLRKRVVQRYNTSVADNLRILYGGSVKPDNANELLSQTDIDGALIGGASLKAEHFLAIAAGAKS